MPRFRSVFMLMLVLWWVHDIFWSLSCQVCCLTRHFGEQVPKFLVSQSYAFWEAIHDSLNLHIEYLRWWHSQSTLSRQCWKSYEHLLLFSRNRIGLMLGCKRWSCHLLWKEKISLAHTRITYCIKDIVCIYILYSIIVFEIFLYKLLIDRCL